MSKLVQKVGIEFIDFLNDFANLYHIWYIRSVRVKLRQTNYITTNKQIMSADHAGKILNLNFDCLKPPLKTHWLLASATTLCIRSIIFPHRAPVDHLSSLIPLWKYVNKENVNNCNFSKFFNLIFKVQNSSNSRKLIIKGLVQKLSKKFYTRSYFFFYCWLKSVDGRHGKGITFLVYVYIHTEDKQIRYKSFIF